MVRTEKIDGIDYNVYTVLYETPLNPGETTKYPVITKVYMDPHVDIDPDGNWHHVEAGVVTDLNWNVEKNGTPVIYVSAYAMQVEGFDTCYAAYEAYQTQWGDMGAEYPEIPNLLDTTEELKEAVMTTANHVVAADIDLPGYVKSEGKGIDSTINLNGYTVTVDRNLAASNSGVGFVAQKYANLVINGPGCVDMNYEGGEKPLYCAPFLLSSNATVTVNGGTYLMGECKRDYHIFSQNTARITINDGTFITSNPNAVIAYCINGYIDINGGFFQNTANPDKALLNVGDNYKYFKNQKITISGGTFVNWNPMTSEWATGAGGRPVMIVLAEGCEVIAETQANGDIWYTVVKQ